MCGIYGTTKYYSKEILKKKLDSFRFRGPDHQEMQEYCYDGRTLVLGHNRLSIIDLDGRSNQPFGYGGYIHIVFNGEIYNYRELKKTYFPEAEFKTTSDTEVLCAMYERFGTSCLSYLNGMFSFVLYDARKELLFGARDRLGKKPFYYSLNENEIEFSSQLAALLIGNQYQIDSLARTYYLMYGCVQEPDSIIKEIKTLRAGDYFTYDLKNKDFSIKKYWDISSNSFGFIPPRNMDEAAETVDFLLKDSIEKRLIADVPIGLFLSGGVDSSLVASYTAKINNNITAYSVGFDEKSYDETAYSEIVAQKLGIRHEKIVCSSTAMLGMLDHYSHYFDEPFADGSAIPTSLLCQVSKQFITVALGGDGADEFFFGYTRYANLRKARLFYFLPYGVRKAIFYPLVAGFKNRKWARKVLYRNIEEYGSSPWNCYENAEKFDWVKLVENHVDANYLSYHDNLIKYSDFDIKTYLNNDINVKTDRASMRSALELRSPFMDYRIAEYSRLLPLECLINNELGQKAVLRKLLYQNIDKKIFERKKQGFSSPVPNWLRNELKELVLDSISETRLQLIPELDSLIVLRMRDFHLLGKGDYSPELWTILMYMTWYDSYKQFIRN